MPTLHPEKPHRAVLLTFLALGLAAWAGPACGGAATPSTAPASPPSPAAKAAPAPTQAPASVPAAGKAFHFSATVDGKKVEYDFNKGDPMQFFGGFGAIVWVDDHPPHRPAPPPPPAEKGQSGATITVTQKDALGGNDSIWAQGMDGEWIEITYKFGALWADKTVKHGWLHGAVIRPADSEEEFPETSWGEIGIGILMLLGMLVLPYGIRLFFGKGCALAFLAVMGVGLLIALGFALISFQWCTAAGLGFLLLCCLGYMALVAK